jgi:hypothetical protein
MSKFKPWPYNTVPPIVYYYKEIQLYPVTDSSTWPFPVRKMNADRVKAAMIWLHNNKISTMGSSVDLDYANTQTLILKFTSELDVTAFTLQFGDLLV